MNKPKAPENVTLKKCFVQPRIFHVINITNKPVDNKKCRINDCTKVAKPHSDNGLYCGDDLCDEHFEEMRQESKKRS